MTEEDIECTGRPEPNRAEPSRAEPRRAEPSWAEATSHVSGNWRFASLLRWKEESESRGTEVKPQLILLIKIAN